jgi:hypothetical protein
VLAGCIQQSWNDGRYSRDNHAWASTFLIPDDRHGGFHLGTHPHVLDGFVDAARGAHVHMMAQDVGKHEQSRRTAERNRLTVRGDDGVFTLKKGTGWERLAERHGEIMEKKEAQRASALERLEAAKRDVKLPPLPGGGKKKDMGLE